MAVKLSFDERKWLLKWHLKVLLKCNDVGRLNLVTTTNKGNNNKNPRQVEVDGTVQDVLKGPYGRKRSSTDNESADAVMQVFARSTKKSLRQCSREIGVEKSSVQRILRAQKWYSISNNPDGMSLCSTSLLGTYCGRRWTFWTGAGLRRCKE